MYNVYMKEENKRGPFSFKNRRIIYESPWTTFYEDAVMRPNGERVIWGITNPGEGSAIVALDSEQNVYLARGYMYALNTEMLVLPGGRIDWGESPLLCAKRELEEELGLRSEKWVHLGYYHMLPARIEDKTDFYLALDVTEHHASDPDGENFTVVKIPLVKAVDMVMNGEIHHAFAAQAILQAWYYINK